MRCFEFSSGWLDERSEMNTGKRHMLARGSPKIEADNALVLCSPHDVNPTTDIGTITFLWVRYEIKCNNTMALNK